VANWSDALKGGLGGATAGMATGNPIGALAGGALGFLGGMFGGGSDPAGSQQNKYLLELAEEAKGRQFDPASYSDFRTDQREHINRLKALASGQGPSLATEMLRKATGDAAANQTAMAAGARGNPALAARQALNNTAGITAQANQAGAMARAQEQLSALQQLGLGIYGARGQDEGMNQFNAAQQAQMMSNNDRIRLMALGGSLEAQQFMSQQPTFGDYLMGAGGSLGQIIALARQGKADQQGQGGMSRIAPGSPGAGGYYTPGLDAWGRPIQQGAPPPPAPQPGTQNGGLGPTPYTLPGLGGTF
jgi:hypothetical protein